MFSGDKKKKVGITSAFVVLLLAVVAIAGLFQGNTLMTGAATTDTEEAETFEPIFIIIITIFVIVILGAIWWWLNKK